MAYGAVTYLCLVNKEGLVTSSLLLCRSQIAPLKDIWLARLELMACLIATRVLCFFKPNFHMKINDEYLWTDSMIALYWFIGKASRLSSS